jgi:hypothetical protein
VAEDISGELKGVAVAGAGADVVYTGNSVALTSVVLESWGPSNPHPLINAADATRANCNITSVDLLLKANDIAFA